MTNENWLSAMRAYCALAGIAIEAVRMFRREVSRG